MTTIPTTLRGADENELACEWHGSPLERARYVVLCVPGIGEVRQSFRGLARAVDEDARDVAVGLLDPRGAGESALTADVSPLAVGRDIVAVVRQVRATAGAATRLTVVGNSAAAASAVWAAAEAPTLVDALVMTGPFVRDIPQSLAVRVMMAVLFNGPWTRAAWMTFHGSLFPTRRPPDHAAYEAALSATLGRPGRLEALRRQLAARKQPCEDRIAEVAARGVPCLVVVGTRDPDYADPAAEGRLVADRLHGELLMVDGAGHYPHADTPDLVVPAILRWATTTSTTTTTDVPATAAATSVE